MRFEEGVLQDYVTELRQAQLTLNTKPEITSEDFDMVIECLNRCEILVLSLLGSQSQTEGLRMVQVGEEFDFDTASAQEVAAKLSQVFGMKAHVILPEDLGMGGDGSGGWGGDDDDGFLEHYGEKAEVPEEEKYSSEDVPKVKS